jgi:glutamate dehydrogenase
MRTALERYFPVPLRERFAAQIQSHPLRREIISTHVVNSMVNRVGPTFVGRLRGELGVSATAVVRAYMATREVFGLVDLWRAIEALDNQVDNALQTELLGDCDRLVQRGTLWFLRHPQWLGDLQATLAHFSPGVASLADRLLDFVAPAYRAELDEAVVRRAEHGVPLELVQRVAALDELYSALDLVEVAVETERPEAIVAQVYFGLGGALDLHWLGRQISALPAETRWQVLARGALRVDLSSLARALAANAVRHCAEGDDPVAVLEAWQAGQGARLERYHALLGEVRAAQSIDMAMVSVVLRELRGMS